MIISRATYIIIIILITSGCCSKPTGVSNPTYIVDQKNEKDNHELCYKTLKERCDKNIRCVGVAVTKVLCSNGECLCD